ncbi:MAG: 30S ribosomal protein S6 [Deltaproteobacteria bacterium RIFCSPLOWO2_02_FULL_50_16]|nr:MAG: 30S ribosomal protein S6 [Deltaproteobacteria bacterium GWA2_50_8]OGQ26255.1 MAG: 30S ribosomal protein S6 [Deltaproteobacteria bacterium RIFCSPHIGHO2_02_FULL_50_15]OGQ56266.1 MAG: 30S ribosomal protein S6 [Deltaproteobacteria bacterium RIFCSPLOWO2_02_FULL_50_16]OGQ65837.1 MAG: 30S ribosomal protein S6 [Deltaproteobacteria bacterium RIFCSPLOWO2_12_FULL_50_11]
MNEYETIYILKDDIIADQISKFQNQMEDVVKKTKGEVFFQKHQGTNHLAYPIQHGVRGHYIQLNFGGDGAVVNELERNLRIADGVIRFLTVLVSKNVDVAHRKKAWSEGEAEPPREAEAKY